MQIEVSSFVTLKCSRPFLLLDSPGFNLFDMVYQNKMKDM